MAEPGEDTAEHQIVFDDEFPDGDLLAAEPVTTVETAAAPRGGQHG